MPWPKGPTAFAALGLLLKSRDPLKLTAACRERYGDVVGIRLPGRRVCLISDPELIEKIFVQHYTRTKKLEMEEFRLTLGQGLLTSRGDLWKRQRSLIQPAFTPARVQRYTATIERETARALDAWVVGEPIEIHEMNLSLSLKIAAAALFGEDSSSIEEPIGRAQDVLLAHFERKVSGAALPLWVPTPSNLRVKREIAAMNEAVLGLIARRRRERAKGDDFLGALLAAQDDAGGMSDEQLRDECMTMILAGHETTATVLTWTLWLLARHPEEARRASASAEHLEHVIAESMRLYPPVWAIGRVCLETLELGDVTLPTGTQAMMLPYFTHRDGRVFDEPDEFRPARWEKPGMRTIPRGSYLPFGSGPRKCVGMHFAQQELRLILGAILARFELTAVDPPESVELQASVTLRPRNGIRLMLSKVSGAQ